MTAKNKISSTTGKKHLSTGEAFDGFTDEALQRSDKAVLDLVTSDTDSEVFSTADMSAGTELNSVIANTMNDDLSELASVAEGAKGLYSQKRRQRYGDAEAKLHGDKNSAAFNKLNKEVTFDIKKHLAVLSIANSGWQRELNIVAWNEGAERYDIRDWNPEHTKMSRGVGLNRIEVKNLLDALSALERLGAL